MIWSLTRCSGQVEWTVERGTGAMAERQGAERSRGAVDGEAELRYGLRGAGDCGVGARKDHASRIWIAAPLSLALLSHKLWRTSLPKPLGDALDGLTESDGLMTRLSGSLGASVQVSEL
jgi:hypothetical protein